MIKEFKEGSTYKLTASFEEMLASETGCNNKMKVAFAHSKYLTVSKVEKIAPWDPNEFLISSREMDKPCYLLLDWFEEYTSEDAKLMTSNFKEIAEYLGISDDSSYEDILKKIKSLHLKKEVK